MAYFTSETTTLARTLLPVRWQRWLAIGGFWTLAGFLSAVHWHYFRIGPDPWQWWELVRVKLLLWYAWGAITPVILWLGYRLRLGAGNWVQRSGILIACSLVITFVYMILYGWLLSVNRPVPVDAIFGGMFRFAVSQHSTYYFLAFWATIGLEEALGYYRRAHERDLRASQLETQLAQAQLQSIRAQLHPHFLFNTLNTVSSVILEGDRQRAYDLTAQLGDLLRTTLERGERQMVSLEEELLFTSRYLDLMSARFEGRLSVTSDAAPDSLRAQVPDMILQPLVENSLKHGVGQSSGPSTISVRSSLAKNRLILEVEDTTTMKQPTASNAANNGYGHRLTQERLRCLYGSEFAFSCSAQPGGMLVRVELPLQYATGTENHA